MKKKRTIQLKKITGYFSYLSQMSHLSYYVPYLSRKYLHGIQKF